MPEFTNRQINGSAGGCSYSNLSNYNYDATSAMYGLPMYSSGPYNPGIPSMAVQVIPQFAAPGYSTLLHDVKGPQCGNYFSVSNAYPGAGSGNCTMFATRKCA
jgi:hypothetical protein